MKTVHNVTVTGPFREYDGVRQADRYRARCDCGWRAQVRSSQFHASLDRRAHLNHVAAMWELT